MLRFELADLVLTDSVQLLGIYDLVSTQGKWETIDGLPFSSNIVGTFFRIFFFFFL